MAGHEEMQKRKSIRRSSGNSCFSIGSIKNNEFRAAFKSASERLKDQYKILTLALAETPTSVLVEMAIERKPPFQEHQINKDHVAIGRLQDCAILFSIMSISKPVPNTGRCAFVSADKIFAKHEVLSPLKELSPSFQLFKNLGELYKDLFEHLFHAIQRDVLRESDEVRKALNAQREQLAKDIVDFFPLVDLSCLGSNLKEIRSLSICHSIRSN